MNRFRRAPILVLLVFTLLLLLYTILVTPRRFLQCLSDPGKYFTRNFPDDFSANVPDFVQGNQTKLLVNGDEAMPALLEQIDRAEYTIRWQVMLFNPDETGRQIAAALAGAARRGVQVQLSFNIGQTVNGTIADGISREQKERQNRQMQAMLADLTSAGVEIRDNPAGVDFSFKGVSLRVGEIQRDIQANTCISANHYDHRKLIIFDSRWAFIGGMNIGRNYLYNVPPVLTEDMVLEAHQRQQRGQPEAWEKWLDAVMLVEGPVVGQMVDAFNWKWQVLGGQILQDESPGGWTENGFPVQFLQQRPGQPEIGARFFELVDGAQREIWVASPFVSYRPALEALQRASRRGVRVVFVFPNKRNEMAISRRIFREQANELLQSGVELYFNNLRMAHTKLMVVDGQQVLVGSFNLNHRSFRHDLEVAAVVNDAALAQQVVDRIFSPYLSISIQVTQPVYPPWNPLDWFLEPFT